MAPPQFKVESEETVLRSKGVRKKVPKVQSRGGFEGGKVIARGPLAKFLVFSGRRFKTVGSLTRKDLMRNKRNRIVSKKAHAWGLKMYHQIKHWVVCHLEARGILNASGFVALNGKTALGKKLYIKTKALYAERKPEVKAEAGRASIPFYFVGTKSKWKEEPAEESNVFHLLEGGIHGDQEATNESKASACEEFPSSAMQSSTISSRSEPEVARAGDATPEGTVWRQNP